VIGGAHSNNTHELVKTCLKYCSRVHHVQTADDLKTEWFMGANTVGITAGTSTPDGLVDSVEGWLRNYDPNQSDQVGRVNSPFPAHRLKAA
jgi:4-hydroxy-3-methylbut-2-enyl diphosphate reductase